jgi:hypothetical protein
MKLPISELTDEEIAKAAMYRLNTKSLMFIYEDLESEKIIFITRWKKDGRKVCSKIKKAIQDNFCKIEPIK